MAGGVLPPRWRVEREALRRTGHCIIEAATVEAVQELWRECPPPVGLWDYAPVLADGRRNVRIEVA